MHTLIKTYPTTFKPHEDRLFKIKKFNSLKREIKDIINAWDYKPEEDDLPF